MKGWIEKLKDEIQYKGIYSAVNPTNALKLIAEIERLEKEIKKLKSGIDFLKPFI